MSFIGSGDSGYCTQIPIAEAVEYLLSEPRKFEYHEQYRKATQAEARTHYNESEGVIMVTALMVTRSGAPSLNMKPFQCYCIVPAAWREAARDRMVEREAKSVFDKLLQPQAYL